MFKIVAEIDTGSLHPVVIGDGLYVWKTQFSASVDDDKFPWFHPCDEQASVYKIGFIKIKIFHALTSPEKRKAMIIFP